MNSNELITADQQPTILTQIYFSYDIYGQIATMAKCNTMRKHRREREKYHISLQMLCRIFIDPHKRNIDCIRRIADELHQMKRITR